MAKSTQNAAELTAEQVQAILVQPLEEVSSFLAAGPRIFDCANQIRIPKLVSGVNGEWTGENEKIEDEDVSLDEVVLLPSTMKSVKTLTKYSNELARQSVVALDTALQDRLVKDVANKLDAQFWGNQGDGITTPKGLFAWAGVTELDVPALTPDVLHDAEGAALGANVDVTKLRWVIRPADLVALRKQKDANGRYLVESDLTVPGGYVLLGHPVTVTNRIPEDSAALVDFSTIAVARDQAPTVKILDQTFGDYDQQAIRVTSRYDVAPLLPEAVIRINFGA